jgi:hypothetical protein
VVVPDLVVKRACRHGRSILSGRRGVGVSLITSPAEEKRISPSAAGAAILIPGRYR